MVEDRWQTIDDSRWKRKSAIFHLSSDFYLLSSNIYYLTIIFFPKICYNNDIIRNNHIYSGGGALQRLYFPGVQSNRNQIIFYAL